MALANNSKPALAANLTRLMEARQTGSRLDLSKQMGVADGTLGRIKYGTGNPTIEVLDQIANFFRVPTVDLLRGESTEGRPSPGGAKGLDVELLTQAVSTALTCFRDARALPTDEKLSAAIAYIYAHVTAGQQLKEVAALVDRMIARASTSEDALTFK